MYDSTVHVKTIARQFRKSDFEPGVLHVPVDKKSDAIERAVRICETGFLNASLFRSNLGGKHVYQHRSIEQALIVRHISENIRRVTGVRQSDRQDIIRSLFRITAQGIAFKAIKLDIKSFYESVDVEQVISSLKSDAAFSRQSVHLLKSFFDALSAHGITGLPRGLALSATLAEYTMRRFDEYISSFKGIFYYSRFVDDIIIITSAEVAENKLVEEAKLHLPNGLNFSRSKSKLYSFNGYISGNDDTEEDAVTFLGYRIGIGHVVRNGNVFERKVRLDISPSKVRRAKTRIARTLLEFNSGGSFKDLLDRIKMLTSNYSFVDYDTGQTRFAGLRYNYSLINFETSVALRELDSFLLSAVVNIHPSNRIKPLFSPTQRRRVLGLTFTSGFCQNRFFSFSNDDVRRIVRCWSHA